jgi:CDP-diacylglycerol pyrophosphatase
MKKPYYIFPLISVILLLGGCQSSLSRQRSEAAHTVRELALGCLLYAHENDGTLPATMTDIIPYVRESFDPDAYVLVATGKTNEIEQPSKAILLRKIHLLPDGEQVVAYVDGHVEAISTN